MRVRLLLCCLTAACATCRSRRGDDGDDDAGADSDTDSDGDSDCQGGGEGEGEGEDDGACRSGDPFANGGCDWTCNTEQYLALRVSALILTDPVTLLDTVVERALDSVAETASLGIVVEITNSSPAAWSADYRAGLAHCEGPGLSLCSFDGAPASGQARFEEDTSVVFVPGMWDQPGKDRVGFSLDLPLVDSCGRSFTLPLRQLGLDASFTDGFGCIGRVEDGPNGPEWQTASALVGLIAVDESENVWIDEAGQSLCDLIAAADCGAEPQTAWPIQPIFTTLDGRPAWGFALRFAALGVSIEE
ncbi:MAG: hypothetical protein HYY06_14955 [Deltaproteobacteria bacterium]|nr:hypothetical protein [Deltaproteobacteria bacterium]